MNTIAESVEVEAPQGRMRVEGHRPESASDPLAGVLVLMEAYGLNAHVRSLTRRLAEAGYVALAPDLYYREQERNLPYASADRAADRVMRTMGLSDAPEERVKDERVLADIAVGLETLRAHRSVDPNRLGVLGLGMGGRLAFLTACRRSDRVRAAVIFYGGPIVPILSEARTLRAPLLMLFGGQDRSIPLPHVDRIQAELAYLGKSHEVKIYPGADQGFLCDERPAHHAEFAKDAWMRTLNWLGKHLG